MTTQRKKNKIWNIIGIACMIVLASFLMKSYHTNRMESDMHKAIRDTLKTFRDINGHQRAIISTIEAEKTELFLEVDSRDTTIQRLQQAIEKYKKEGFSGKPGSSVTVVSGNTSFKGSAPTQVDEASIIPLDYFFPTYRSRFNLDEWVTGNIVATKDSTTIDLNIRNEFDFIIDYEPTGFLGAGKPKATSQFVSLNPYTTVNELRTFQVSQPPAINMVIGPSLGYGFGGWFAGVTVTYPLIKLRL